MIRTRDFLLYILVLSFVVIGASYTGFSGRAVAEVQELFFTSSAPVESTAITPSASDERSTRWAELRARLAAGDGYLDDAPPVFTSVDQTAQQLQAEAATNTPTFTGTRTVTWCTGPQPSRLLANWPAQAQLEMVEGQRVVTERVAEMVQTGSTTETVVREEFFLSLPVRTVRSTFTSCLPDTLIGITTAGQPLLNSDAARYANVSMTQVIGYTRDGFSVYGPVADEAVLDECGGQYVAGQYQYHVRLSESFILACYAGVPASS